jgi:hypothetical protein
MHRILLLRFVATLVIAVAIAGEIPAHAVASSPYVLSSDGTAITATYEGVPIGPWQASQHFCHTRDYPIVRCFASQAEVDADLGWTEPTAPAASLGAGSADGNAGGTAPDWAGGPYTIAYWDINYGGNALTVYGAVPNLGAIGWNDAISSMKSVNCGLPRYYENINYGGWYWQNGCNVWTANLYDFNDTFSSVVNMAP